jgi:hypothetical protein
MSIVLPDWVARNMQREQVLQSADPAQVKYWNRRLKELDPHLALAWAGEFASGPGIVPGRWHIRRKNLVGADTYWPVQTPDGGFREMSSQVLEQFQAADLWNSQVRADRDRSFARAERSADRAKLREKEDRVDHLRDHINVQERPQVSFSDGAWTNRASGRRGRKAA